MAPKKHSLPSPLPDAWILTDSEKKKWRLGKVIGKGGFGLIYLASQDLDVPVRDDADFVIKVEYHENGPLFSELKFYQRAAKPDNINKWQKSKKLEFLGIPTYWGSGLSEHKGTMYRFMVMDRLGTDLQKVFIENGGQLRKPTVLQLGVLMLDVLEYIHDNEYVHADIKAANLLLGHKDPSKVFLADYGLSYRYCPNGQHKEYKENPKKGHNGTIEYTSIDAHKGVAPSRRGDLEVLGYCLLHWQCGTLPWLSSLRNPAEVQGAKAKLMSNLPDSVINMSTSGSSTAEIARFLFAVQALGYNDKPDYQALRKILSETGLQGPLDLSRPRALETARPATQRTAGQLKPNDKKTARLKPVVTLEDDEEEVLSGSPNKIWNKTKPKTREQRPPNFATKGGARQRPMPKESDEEYSDEDETLPPQVHPRTRAGLRQRQERKQPSQIKVTPTKQERRKADFYEDEAWMSMRRELNNHHIEHRGTQPLHDSRKHIWNHNRWRESDYGDHWGRTDGGWGDKWTRNSHMEGDECGESENHNQGKWNIKMIKDNKVFILVVVVVILAAVGSVVLRLRLSR